MKKYFNKMLLLNQQVELGNSLVVQWLGLGAFSGPGQGTTIPQAARPKKKKSRVLS